MAYSVLAKMTKDGDKRPLYASFDKAYPKEKVDKGLKSMATRFLHDRCEGLRFDLNTCNQENGITDEYTGTSAKANQIPYNMQMDIDRLTFENALRRFLDSGKAQDAFDVYFCYIEMFMGKYSKCRHVVEMLSEFEANGSSLLMKHRDHYSHSVYVFAIGLAIFETNAKFRSVYTKYYKKEIESITSVINDNEAELSEKAIAAYHYLEFWGLSSLFHDIGYPFELPFEELYGYFEEDRDDDDKDSKDRKTDRGNRPFMAYHDIKKYTGLDDEKKKSLDKLFGKNFETTDDLFAYVLYQKMGKKYHFSKDSMTQVLSSKPERPDLFTHFMDHAYFSANTLFRELWETIGINESDKTNVQGMRKTHFDALTAILMHNSLYKFSISFYKDKDINVAFKMEIHPLAYMLMLCDELQCWDRTAYGRNTRTQVHPMECQFMFDTTTIEAQYIFDEDERGKIDEYLARREKAIEEKAEKLPKLKSYSDYIIDDRSEKENEKENEKEKRKISDFQADIEKIVVCNIEGFELKVLPPITQPNDNTKKQMFLSDTNYIHLYNFAVALNARFAKEKASIDQIEDDFNSLSLEYKISNINQAKNFSGTLDTIGCFYTDKSVNLPLIEKFSKKDLSIIGPIEHGRWVREHKASGWIFGDSYVKKDANGNYTKEEDRKARECLRIHRCMMDEELTEKNIQNHYETLPEADKDKDTKPWNTMIQQIGKFDGLRLYRYKEVQ
ncbi:MAG: hypothetical protein IKP88_14530 [Lachnospiraceae bacterium]|nr:hypothetical protein [Lachnospiraceae bacterium]